LKKGKLNKKVRSGLWKKVRKKSHSELWERRTRARRKIPPERIPSLGKILRTKKKNFLEEGDDTQEKNEETQGRKSIQKRIARRSS